MQEFFWDISLKCYEIYCFLYQQKNLEYCIELEQATGLTVLNGFDMRVI